MTRGGRGGALLILAAALAAGCRGDEPQGGPPPPEVLVAAARLGAVPDRREYVGTVRAVREVEVRARVRGYLVEQAFEDGERVAAGELLFRIDPSSYEVVLAEARAELVAARAEAKRADLEYERARSLSQDKVVSQAILDARLADRDSAHARVARAEAAVRGAELDLSYCTVTAPLAGRIGERLVDVGNLVGGSDQDTVLARIVQIDPIYVYFAPTELERLEVLQGVREGRIPTRREGSVPVAIELGDGTPYPHRGVVDYVDPTIDPTRGTVTVRALVPNPDDVLKPGEFVRLFAIFPDREAVVLVPQRAVLEEQGGSFVLVVGPDGTVERRGVALGVLHEGLQGVSSGLSPGERVVVEGVQKARPGQKVVPQPLEGEGPPAAVRGAAAGAE